MSYGDDTDEEFQASGKQALALHYADEAARLQNENQTLRREIARLRAAQERQVNMSGKTKKLLAILATLGITASGVTEFLGHVSQAFPQNHTLGAACALASTIIGVLVAYHPVSVKDPNAGKPELPPVQK